MMRPTDRLVRRNVHQRGNYRGKSVLKMFCDSTHAISHTDLSLSANVSMFTEFL